MYARLGKDAGDAVTGAIEVCTLRRLAGADELVLSLWPTAAEAGADPTAEWYELEADQPGGGRDQQPTTAALVCFDGPLSEPVHAAAQRAGNDRIGPRMRDHEETVRALVLWQPERHSLLVVMLATSVDAIEDGQRVILSTELLPGEDPALLPEPDRVDVYRVRSATVAGAAPSRPRRNSVR